MDCIKAHNGKCAEGGGCPFETFLEKAMRCASFLPDDIDPRVKVSAMEREAAWEDVKAKGEAIIAADGVQILDDNPSYVEALVMSGDVADRFPVDDGGPYRVILSKTSWENKGNVGGWIQGYLCECKWGSYHSGEPGPGYQGRFCSHAYAAMVVADVRARHDFMNDRRASMMSWGDCVKCGEHDQVSLSTGLCAKCGEEAAFASMAKAMFGTASQRRAAEEELTKADDSVIEDIEDNMEVEERGDISIARWHGHQAVFSERRTAALEMRDMDEVTPNGRYEAWATDEIFVEVSLFVEGWGWDAFTYSGGPIDRGGYFGSAQEALDDFNEWMAEGDWWSAKFAAGRHAHRKAAWLDGDENLYEVIVSANGIDTVGSVRMTEFGHLYAYWNGEGEEFTEQPDWNPANRHDEIDAAVDWVMSQANEFAETISGFDPKIMVTKDDRYALDRFGSVDSLVPVYDAQQGCYVYRDYYYIYEPDGEEGWWVDCGGERIRPIDDSLEGCIEVCNEIIESEYGGMDEFVRRESMRGKFADHRLDGMNIYPIDLEDMAHQGGSGMPDVYLYRYEDGPTLEVIYDDGGTAGWRWGLNEMMGGDSYLAMDADYPEFNDGFDSPQRALRHFNDFATTDSYDNMFEARRASRRTATRKFTYAEMQELEDEVKGKPYLNNADRLKEPDACMFY